jgi:hypothetical protein
MLATSAKAETEEITNAVQAPGYRAGITDAVAERCRVLDRDGGGAARHHPAVAIDPDAAGNDAGIDDATAEESAAADRDAAGADGAGVGHAAAEGGMADHQGVGVAAERRGIGPGKAKRPPDVALDRSVCRGP